MKKIYLEIVVFVCGAVVMAYEITGSRMLGPFVGTSYIVWTSIIGVILLSLSTGYYFGGRIADRRPQPGTLALIILIAGLAIFLSTMVKDKLLDFLLDTIESLKLISVLASLILFTIPSLMLGMVSPFAARLKMNDVRDSGKTVGNLYAISTIGSICGVFMSGFWLIPAFNLSAILYFFAIILIVVTIFLNFVIYFAIKRTI